jgi:L-lactate dehydrogenase complex protein LldG
MDHRRDTLTPLYATFSTNLAAAGGIAHRTQSTTDAVETIAGLPGDLSPKVIWLSSRVQECQPEIIAGLRDAGYELSVPDQPATVRDKPVGLTIARVSIAETGSVLLHEPGIADRSVSLMTNLLIVVCPINELVPSLDEAAGVLREISKSGSSYATFVTGPSRTADIERQLTIGVQGPAVMHVVFVPDMTSM